MSYSGTAAYRVYGAFFFTGFVELGTVFVKYYFIRERRRKLFSDIFSEIPGDSVIASEGNL